MTIEKQALALQALKLAQETARAQVNRETAQGQIGRYLALFGLPFAVRPGQPTPYCAAFVAYMYAKAYANLTGVVLDPSDPVWQLKAALAKAEAMTCHMSASVAQNIEYAKGAGIWAARKDVWLKDVKPGWIVCFNWGPDHDGNPERHTGLVRTPGNLMIGTVEGNTSNSSQSNGGAVAERTRMGGIEGFIRTY